MLLYSYAFFENSRKRVLMEFDAVSDERAWREVSPLYRDLIRVRGWEQRKLFRYSLFCVGEVVAGRSVEREPRFVGYDIEILLTYEFMRHSNPPHDAASEAALDAEFRRLSALDAERRAKFRKEWQSVQGGALKGD